MAAFEASSVLWDYERGGRYRGQPRRYSRAYDVVALHGLHGCGGKGHESWTLKQGDEQVMWLTDILPRQHLHGARVMEFNYSFKSEDDITAENIESLAINLVRDVNHQLKTDTSKRRLIFVGHDLGGVIIKQALSIAAQSDWDFCVVARTARLIFFATPHNIHELDSWDTISHDLMRTCGREARESNPQRQISNLSSALQLAAENFDRIAGLFDIVNVFEDRKIGLDTNPLVIDRHSATFGPQHGHQTIIGRDKSHLELATFSAKEVDPLKRLFDGIRELPEHRVQLVECLVMLSTSYPDTLVPACRPTVGKNTQDLLKSIYQPWLNSKENVLTIRGAPGTGKTELAAVIIENLKFEERSNVISFSVESADSRRNSADKLLASLTYQLICQRPELFVHAAKLRWLFWKDPQLWALFRSLLSCPHHETTICVINHVDQCDGSTKSCITRLKTLASKPDYRFRLILTENTPELCSKGEAPKEDSRSGDGLTVPCYDLQEENYRMALAELSSFISENPGFEWLQDEAPRETLLAGRPTILQVKLKLALLRDSLGPSPALSMNEDLSGLPGTTDELYQRLIDRIPLAQNPWAENVLMWVSLACRPMKLEELSVAIALGSGVEHITDITAQLPLDFEVGIRRVLPNVIKIDRGEVTLVHGTLRDYLLRTQSNGGHATITELCLRYFSAVSRAEKMTSQSSAQGEGVKSDDAAEATEGVEGGSAEIVVDKQCEKLIEESPLNRVRAFSRYAVKYWPEHYHKALSDSLGDGNENTEEAKERGNRIRSLLGDTRVIEYWAMQYSTAYLPDFWESGSDDYLVMIATRIGCFPLVDLLLNRSTLLRSRIQRESILDSKIQQEALPSSMIQQKALNASLEIGDRHTVARLAKRQKIQENKQQKHDALLQVASWGHVELLDVLELGSDDVEITDTEGMTMLHRACEKGHEDMVEELLSRGLKTEARDETGATALHLAARYGHEDIARSLIDKQACLDARDNCDCTPLHLACGYQNAEMVKILLGAGATVVAMDKFQVTPIHVASSTGRLDIFEMLLERLPQEEVYGQLTAKACNGSMPIHFAAASNAPCAHHANVVKALLDRDEKLRKERERPMRLARDNNGDIALHHAASCGRVENAHILLERFAQDQLVVRGNKTDSMPIHLAVFHGHTEVVSRICEFHHLYWEDGVGLDISGGSTGPLLHYAVAEGDTEIAKSLIIHGAIVDRRNFSDETPLMGACMLGFVDIVRLLLDNRADPMLTNSRYQSCLQIAVASNQLGVVRELLSPDDKKDEMRVAQAELLKTSHDRSGRSPLVAAIVDGHFDGMRELKSQGVPWDITADSRQLVCHSIDGIENMRVDGIKFLLDNNELDLSQTTEEKRTLVSLAAGAGNLNLTRLLTEALISQGKQWDVGDDSGMTPFLYAAEAGMVEVVRFFLVDVPRINESFRVADVDEVDREGRTALFHAKQGGHKDVVDLLLENNADPSIAVTLP